MKIGMTSVFVDDPVRAFHFYTEVLGFSKKLFVPGQWLAIVVSAEDVAGTSLMLEPKHNAIAKRYQQGLYKAGIRRNSFNYTRPGERISEAHRPWRAFQERTDQN
jgi:catechol 2,3-dioxygenase-like lactoylglutathione lyase family enzyme